MSVRPSSSRRQRTGRGPAGDLYGLLSAIFNVVVVSMLWSVTSLPLVTLPFSTAAAYDAMHQWSLGTESRVVSSFWRSAREDIRLRFVSVGVVLLVGIVGACDIGFFLGRVGPLSSACVGIGGTFLLLAVLCLGYVLLLVTRSNLKSPLEVWLGSARLAATNLLITGPLFVLEFGLSAFIAWLDPPLLVIVVPATLLWVLSRTASYGFRRAQRGSRAGNKGEACRLGL